MCAKITNSQTGDILGDRILDYIKSSMEPLETSDVIRTLKSKEATRIRIVNRLMGLAISHKINAKKLSAARGVWIWWKK